MPSHRLAFGLLLAAALLLLPGPETVPAAEAGPLVPIAWSGALLLTLAGVAILAAGARTAFVGGRD